MNYKATMASARVFFSKKRRQQRNGFINDEIPVVENGYDPQESEEDEVFVQDPNIELSASKPLMHPRSKTLRGAKVHTRTLESCRLCALCKPIFYFVVLVTVLCGIMASIVYIANKHEGSKNSGVETGSSGDGSSSNDGRLTSDQSSSSVRDTTFVIGCDRVAVEDVWVVGFPKVLTESALRLVDVNGDGTDDVILGFATGADGHGVNPVVCDLYFGGQRPCLGGVMAVEGQTGKELWRRYTDHEVYGLNCQVDLDGDGTKDCLAGGRAGVLVGVSGKDGALLWNVGRPTSKGWNPVMNMYTPQYVPDLNGDEVPDILVVHGGDPLQEAGSEHRLSGRILLLSGKSGEVLRSVGVPDGRESYYSPELLRNIDGSLVLLFGTGGETHNGSLWRVELDSVKKGLVDRAVKISSDGHKGFMTPAALVDITVDGTPDLLVPSFNSTLLAIDGKDYQPLWSVHFPSSESYSTPAVGHYNDDDIPDVMVKYAHGPGFPVYYYSETTVLDGKTGAKLIDPPLRDTIGSQASPLTIAMEGPGNDVFMSWMSDCKGHEGATDEFTFTKGTSHSDKSKSDLCGLRFNSHEVSRLMLLGRNLPKEGIPIYNSDTRKKEEHSQWVNTTAQAYDYVMKHPEILMDYSTDTAWKNPEAASTLDTDQGLEGGNYYNNNPSYSNAHRIGSKKGPSGPAPAPNRGRTLDNTDKGYNSGYTQGSRGSARLSPSRGNGDTRYGGTGRDSRWKEGPTNYYDNNNDYDLPYANNRGGYGSPYGTYFNGDDENVYGATSPFIYRNDPSYSSSSSSSTRHRSSRRRGRRRRRRGVEGVVGEGVHDDGGGDDERLKMRRLRRKVLERMKRHVGAHDNDGVQRLISTGTLAPPLLPVDHADYNRSIDVIFATYWSYPSPVNTLLLSKDQKCIADRMAKEGVDTFDTSGLYYQMSHDEYQQAVTIECLKRSKGDYLNGKQGQEEMIYSDSDSAYNPFNLKMGQMTLYRIRLTFSCSSKSSNLTNTDDHGSSSPGTGASKSKSRCATVLPFHKQKWSAYMGANGDGYWSVPYQ